MRVITRLYFLNNDDERFFGEGPYRLLKKVEETGSLHSASAAMGMAYSKATKLLKHAEESLGFPLTVRKIGGKSGGGSELTQEAKDFISRYESYRNECVNYSEKIYCKYFDRNETSAYGCVIMASGLGKRFGGDKLMAQLLGKPMIQYVIEATEGLFDCRVVVTRNEKVKAWCEERKIPVVFHELPDRNDTIRLGVEEIEKRQEGEIRGCVFCPADMPFVNHESIKQMLLKAGKQTSQIVRMSCQEEVGAPVLFGRDYFEQLKTLPKKKGGSEIIRENKDKLLFVEAQSEKELWDVDTKEDLEKVKNEMIHTNIKMNIDQNGNS